MPKIIENIERRILDTAGRQIRERGYTATTIRSVAQECGIAVGTVYNYYESKDMMIARFMLEDWNQALAELREKTAAAQPGEAAEAVYEGLKAFRQRYQQVFGDVKASQSSAALFSARHEMLRGQLAELLLPVCQAAGRGPAAFQAQFVAEALLSWSSTERSFGEIYDILKLLFVEEEKA